MDETDRSLHDALCVVRALVKNRGTVPGGGAPEVEISQKLAEYSRTLSGVESLVVRAYADALEVVPYTLAENAGLNPIVIVTELRNRHIKGEKECGINVKRGICDNMVRENVVQPALVTQSALTLATECVRMILKIDDLVKDFLISEFLSVIRSWLPDKKILEASLSLSDKGVNKRKEIRVA